MLEMARTLEAVSDQPALEKQPPRRSRLRTLWPLGACVAAASTISLVAKSVLFPLFSGNSDEAVYIYQARMLTQGHATLSAGVHAEFFYPWLFGQRNGRLFPRYQPAWPTVIAVGHALGSEKIALVVAAAAVTVAVWFLAEEFERGSAVFAVGVFLLSPIFIVQSATYLPYLWITALVTGALAAALAGLRTRRPSIFLVCGILLGIAQLTRPFDALIFALPIVAFLFGRLVTDDARELRKTLVWIGLGVLPFVAVTLVYNTHVTGAPLRFPQQVAEPLDTFGFGPRRFAPEFSTLDYDRQRAVRGLQLNGTAMVRWLAGGGIGVVLALAAVALRRKRAETWLLFVLTLAFPAAYFFWWGTVLSGVGARNGLGPHYYVPAFAPLAVLAGWSLFHIARRSARHIAVTCVAIVVGSALVLPGIYDNASKFTERNARVRKDGITSVDLSNAVVVNRGDPQAYILKDFQSLVGDPSLDDDVLYAIDRGARTVDLAAQFPTRKLYQWVQHLPPDVHSVERRDLIQPIEITTGTRLTLRLEVVSTQEPVTSAYLSFDGEVIEHRVLDGASTPGEKHIVTVVLVAPDGRAPRLPAKPGTFVVPITRDGVLQVGAAFGPDRKLETAQLYEQRYFIGFATNDTTRIAVQTPALQYHLLRTPDGETWLPEDVSARLTEREHRRAS
jgi:Dolichyl-phosphate-mannose-protein mannosyltransferase